MARHIVLSDGDGGSNPPPLATLPWVEYGKTIKPWLVA